MSLAGAVASLLGKKDHEDYRDVGVTLLAKDLYKLLGLTNSPMLYKYMSNKDSKIDPERAKVFLDKFDILIDIWLTPDELARDCTNAEAGRAIAYQPIKEIIEDIVEIDSIQDNTQMRRQIKLLIAKWY